MGPFAEQSDLPQVGGGPHHREWSPPKLGDKRWNSMGVSNGGYPKLAGWFMENPIEKGVVNSIPISGNCNYGEYINIQLVHWNRTSK